LHPTKEGIDFSPVGGYDNSIWNLGGKKPKTEKREDPRLSLQRASGALWPNLRDEEENDCEEGQSSTNSCDDNSRLEDICVR